MNDYIGATVRRFILEKFLHRNEESRAWDHVSLLRAGAIDSVSVLELVLWLESTFELSIADEDIVPANLDSIAAISRYVERRLARRRLERVA